MRESNVFTHVCLSTAGRVYPIMRLGRGGGVDRGCGRGLHTSLPGHTTRDGHRSGRYTSYWNAYLFEGKFVFATPFRLYVVLIRFTAVHMGRRVMRKAESVRVRMDSVRRGSRSARLNRYSRKNVFSMKWRYLSLLCLYIDRNFQFKSLEVTSPKGGHLLNMYIILHLQLGDDDFRGDIFTDIEKKCPDQTSHCPDNNTCCLNTKGAYSCCPVPNVRIASLSRFFSRSCLLKAKQSDLSSHYSVCMFD